jgi:hypothetical protein
MAFVGMILVEPQPVVPALDTVVAVGDRHLDLFEAIVRPVEIPPVIPDLLVTEAPFGRLVVRTYVVGIDLD